MTPPVLATAADPTPPRRWDGWLARPLVTLLRGYQRWLSPALAPACRYVPSCSHYAVQALETHPVWRALGLVTWRLLRCQPLCRGGLDPVPPRP